MEKNFPGEQWKKIKFGFPISNEGRIEVSNFGRLRTFNKLSHGNIINGTMINGYRIIRLKLYEPREEKMQSKLDYLQQQVFKLARKLKKQKDNGEGAKTIADTTAVLNTLKQNLSKKYRDDLKSRTINYHSLVHRLVAEYFLKRKTASQTIVAHLNFNKLDNRASNLAWMTPEENYEHQRSSPYVIEEKKLRQHRRREDSRSTKLTVTKVMLLKKLLNEDKPMKQLVKQFKVTHTQILRIKRGENWKDIPAAK